MQKLWCVQHKNIKGLQEGLHMGDILLKKYVLWFWEMVKLGEIKDMSKGTVGKHDHLQGNNHEILWAVCGRDYVNL